uniref:Uncharacterized protein n=2 Tax=Rhizophora mucronata TaxID=61149 RepID=A0A2P2JDE9_RHIMU
MNLVAYFKRNLNMFVFSPKKIKNLNFTSYFYFTNSNKF